MFKNFLLKKMLKSQGVPEEQIDMVLSMMEKDPELFKKIAEEVQEKIKSGQDQMAASMEVMRKYQDQIKKLNS
jgi:DNA-binding transcriptional MerR regulator